MSRPLIPPCDPGEEKKFFFSGTGRPRGNSQNRPRVKHTCAVATWMARVEKKIFFFLIEVRQVFFGLISSILHPPGKLKS